jgi:signal transduction histidine kinase/CheY-like chemotaxis protein
MSRLYAAAARGSISRMAGALGFAHRPARSVCMTSRGRLLLPFLLLAAGLLATAAAAFAVARAENGRREARFEQVTDSVVGAIEGRMLAQLTLLRGAAGFFNASDRVTRGDFANYVERLRLESNYPGVLGIGYAAYAPDRPALDAIVAEARRDIPDFAHRPVGERPDYSTILYLHPLDRLNRAALGYDMLSEATRRAAMAAAARSGSGVMSGRVRLVQEIDPVKQPGFLIYLPLFRPASPGEPQRLYGWVYSPLRAHDLFGAIFAGHDLGGVTVEIYDEQVGEERLLYRNAAPEPGASETISRQVEIAGRTWIVRTASTAAFEGTRLLGPGLVGGGGALISLLVFFLSLQQVRAAGRIERQVAARTAELQAANIRLQAEVDARTEAEAKVAQMQKLEAIGQLTGGIAHDFNNMLTVIIGNLDIAQRRASDPERAGRAIANAREGAAKAAELTQRLLAFGRQQALAPRVLDVNRLIDGMSELLRRAIGEAIRLDRNLAGDLWPVCADATQLESAILNLAINARDAMAQGGVLGIDTANASLGESDVLRPADLAPGDYVAIALRDTGHGMSPDVAARALDPFFTTKPAGRGTGLGLSQVFGFVKQSGGHLTLASEIGAGTIVTIYLPRHEGAEDAAEVEREVTSLPRGSAQTILVVEDEAAVREMSCDTLRELGYIVLEAADGEQALAALDRHPGVDLLFTDVVMPGMNGRQLAEAALALRPALKILYTTGYARDALAADGRLEAGVSLLQKPFTAAALAARVREALES